MVEDVKQETATQDTAVQDTAPATQPVVQTTSEEKVKQDIANMKQHLANLEQDDKNLYADEIKSLKTKIAVAESKLQQEAKTVVDDAEKAEKSFLQKYGNEILNGVEILALIAILYRLFIF